MAFSIRNPEASALARRLAEMEHTSITEAVVTALNEAITARLKKESAVETARRVLDRHGIVLTERMRKPVPQSVWDELHDDPADGDDVR